MHVRETRTGICRKSSTICMKRASPIITLTNVAAPREYHCFGDERTLGSIQKEAAATTVLNTYVELVRKTSWYVH